MNIKFTGRHRRVMAIFLCLVWLQVFIMPAAASEPAAAYILGMWGGTQ